MAKALYLLLIATICFMYTLNLFLRGSKKKNIEAVLGLLVILSVIASFFLFNWKWGVICFVSPFILVGLFRPIVEALAFKLLGYRTGVD